jgi:hypothetical protein
MPTQIILSGFLNAHHSTSDGFALLPQYYPICHLAYLHWKSFKRCESLCTFTSLALRKLELNRGVQETKSVEIGVGYSEREVGAELGGVSHRGGRSKRSCQCSESDRDFKGWGKMTSTSLSLHATPRHDIRSRGSWKGNKCSFDFLMLIDVPIPIFT